MTQRLVSITVDRVGSKDLIRAKETFFRLLVGDDRQPQPFLTERDRDRMEGLLHFLDACTDKIKDGDAITMGEGPENWEDT